MTAPVAAARAPCAPGAPESLFAFVKGPVFSVIDPPTRVAPGDFDGDGRSDLAVLSDTAATVTVYLRAGTGLSLRARLPTPPHPDRLLVQDVDRDGALDLVVAARATGAVALLRGPDFATRLDYDLPPAITALALLDVDGDGRDDLVAAHAGRAAGGIDYLAGRDGGGFATTPARLWSYGVLDLRAADCDADGRLDLVAGQEDTCCGRYSALAFLAVAGGRAAGPVVTPLGARPNLLLPADYDGDGRIDLFDGPCGAVYFGLGAGKFEKRYYEACFSWDEGVAVDLSGDGRADVVGRAPAQSLALTWATYNGYYLQTEFQSIASPEPIDGLAALDWDGDGRSDLVVTSGAARTLRILRPNPTLGWFGFASLSQCTNLDVIAGDLDRDGRTDLVSFQRNTCGNPLLYSTDITASTFRANAQGALVGGPGIGVYAHGLWERGVLADLDANGTLDLLSVTPGGVFRVDGIGDGGFAPPVLQAFPHPVSRLGLADFNLDGRLDMLVLEGTPPAARLYLQVNGNAFQGAATLATQPGFSALALADLNEDGWTDVALADSLRHVVELYAGSADGSFAPLAVASVGLRPVDLVVTDFDLDGQPEIVTANRDSEDLSILRLTDGTVLTPVTTLPSPGAPVALAAGDANGDDFPDLLVGHVRARTTLYLGRCDGSFQAAVEIPHPLGPRRPALADVNADGRPDLILGSEGGLYYPNLSEGRVGGHAELSTVSIVAEASGSRVTWSVRGWAARDRFRLFAIEPTAELTLVTPRYFEGRSRHEWLDSSPGAAGRHYLLEMASTNGVIRRIDWPQTVPLGSLVRVFTAERRAGRVRIHWELARRDDAITFHVFRQSGDDARAPVGADAFRGSVAFDLSDEAPPAGAVDYWLRFTDPEGRTQWWGPAVVGPLEEGALALALGVVSAHPARGAARLRYELPADGRVTLRVFDAAGRVVRTLLDGPASAGVHLIDWPGRDDQGRLVAGGLYFVRLEVGARTLVRRVVHLR